MAESGGNTGQAQRHNEPCPNEVDCVPLFQHVQGSYSRHKDPWLDDGRQKPQPPIVRVFDRDAMKMGCENSLNRFLPRSSSPENTNPVNRKNGPHCTFLSQRHDANVALLDIRALWFPQTSPMGTLLQKPRRALQRFENVLKRALSPRLHPIERFRHRIIYHLFASPREVLARFFCARLRLHSLSRLRISLWETERRVLTTAS